MEIRSAGNQEVSRGSAILVAGANSLEKMRFASTIPDALWVTSSTEINPFLASKGIHYMNVSSIDDLLALRKLLSSDLRETLGFEISTLIFSPFERIQQKILEERVGGKHPSFEDWAWLKQKCHGIVSAFKQCEVDLVFLTSLNQVGDTGEFVPSIVGGFGNEIYDYLDAAWLLSGELSGEVVDVEVDSVKESEDGELSVEGESVLQMNSWLITQPLTNYWWMFDSTENLSPVVTLTGDNDYAEIQYLRNLPLPDSKILYPSEEEETSSEDTEGSVSQDGKLLCDECGAPVPKNWAKLSELKGFPPLCKKHYAEASGN